MSRSSWSMLLKTFSLLTCALFLLPTFSCGVGRAPLAGPAQSPNSPTTLGLPPPVVARLQQQVRTDLERYVGAQQASAIQALSAGKYFPAKFKLPLVVQGLSDPWTGMIALENHGYLIAALAKAGRQHLPALIEAMEAGMGRTPEPITFLPIPTGENAEEYVTYLLPSLNRLTSCGKRRCDGSVRRSGNSCSSTPRRSRRAFSRILRDSTDRRGRRPKRIGASVNWSASDWTMLRWWRRPRSWRAWPTTAGCSGWAGSFVTVRRFPCRRMGSPAKCCWPRRPPTA